MPIKPKGFTLIELMISMAIFGIFSTAIFKVYIDNAEYHTSQERVATAQSNIRVSTLRMLGELRLAGCDPTGNAEAGITTADADTITFTMDITGGETDGVDNDNDDPDNPDEADESNYSDGTIANTANFDETVTYVLSGGDLTRNGAVIAEDIEVLNFVYLDGNGDPTATTADMRSIQIAIIARAFDRNISDNKTYKNLQGTTILNPSNLPADDKPLNYRRRLVRTTIRLRNMGLEST
ncbi:prepilin-type N-terminal cleavage/methylation domain-containing protein [Desulfobacterales bacterium HSG17]|nr:prepilin-type N-terminal cleavage/methylation domain-containing protein [Desulfobacterales bacterium HSG17]